MKARFLLLFAIGLSLYSSIAGQNCTCPQFQIVSPLEMVKAGDKVEFEITSADPAVFDGKFDWTTSMGTIVSGQGTRKITVETSVEMLTASQSTPTPFPPAGPDGYILTGGISRRRPRLSVAASLADPNCQCRPPEHSIQIGRENRERNKPADATDLNLSADNLTLPCRPGYVPAPNTKVSPSMVIDVGVTAHDPENDILTFNYTVSGGKIVGAGANVKWDLTDVYPGSYTITGGVDDGCGICGKTQTKTVTVAACEPSCVLCQCATVEIAGPTNEILEAGDNVFTANVTAGTYDPTYEWIVDGGEIVSGQGTPSISVKFDPQTLKSKKSVTVRIGGAPESCACAVEYTLEYVNGRRKL